MKRLFSESKDDGNDTQNKTEENDNERRKHDKAYSNLLEYYVDNEEKTLIQKRWFKFFFFIIVITIFVVTFVCFFCSLVKINNIVNIINNNKLNSNNQKLIIEMLTIVIPPLLSLIVAFIKIPEIIARYLFNIKEEEYMTSIIKNLQDYDASIFFKEEKIDEKDDSKDEIKDDALKVFFNNILKQEGQTDVSNSNSNSNNVTS